MSFLATIVLQDVLVRAPMPPGRRRAPEVRGAAAGVPGVHEEDDRGQGMSTGTTTLRYPVSDTTEAGTRPRWPQPSLRTVFADLAMMAEPDGTTLIEGDVVDQVTN